MHTSSIYSKTAEYKLEITVDKRGIKLSLIFSKASPQLMQTAARKVLLLKR